MPPGRAGHPPAPGPCSPGAERGRRDGGQAIMGLAVLLAVVTLLGLLVAHMGTAAADRAAARTAADASALAAAVGGPAAAAEASRRNGATLESVTVNGDGAEVTVRVGRATASARAQAGTLAGAGSNSNASLMGGSPGVSPARPSGQATPD
jgi:hypothetical protein